MTTPGARWRRCNNCKSDIGFEQTYWVCSVSTCNRKRTGLVFCTVSCWDAHLPLMRHREAWAEDRESPSQKRWQQEQASAVVAPSPAAAGDRPTPQRRVARRSPSPSRQQGGDAPREILIVISKLKQYIRARSGFNTADGVGDVLSDHVRALCDHAISRARENERRTVMDRDFRRP